MNVITERHEIGITMNLGKYPVIGLDMDNKPYKECDGFIVGSKVKVAWDRKDPKWEGMTSRCKLVVGEGKYQLKYQLNSPGCCLSADFTVYDFIKDVENANTPLVHKEQIVAVAHYSKSNGVKFLRMMKVSTRIDTQCMTVATLEDLNDEEMKEVRDFIDRRKRW